MSVRSHPKFKRKKVIVFAFEGKNNKTEKMYFSHFKPSDDDYILKTFSSGVTDIKNMIDSTKAKRKEYDYHANEDITYIFVDADADNNKLKQIRDYKSKQPNDIHIIISNPTFEIWFLNHFIRTNKEMTNSQLLVEISKHLIDYSKNVDYFEILEGKIEKAISNSKFQMGQGNDNPISEVVSLFEDNIIVKK